MNHIEIISGLLELMDALDVRIPDGDGWNMFDANAARLVVEEARKAVQS